MNLKIRVVDIQGDCPVYEIGDTFSIVDGYKLSTRKVVCMHSLASLMPYYVAISHGVNPKEFGLGDGEVAYVQCLDPMRKTGGGTVTFSISREDE